MKISTLPLFIWPNPNVYHPKIIGGTSHVGQNLKSLGTIGQEQLSPQSYWSQNTLHIWNNFLTTKADSALCKHNVQHSTQLRLTCENQIF